jgi:actin-related protein 5
MKTLANLASDTPTKKRRRGGDDDNFGANDDDWGVYRQVAVEPGSDDEEEEDPEETLKKIEKELLEHDPDFTEEQTHGAQTDWTKSIMHAFLRGPRPFDPASAREAHQIHLNVERIRVPEVIFQPAIAGLDQAGIVEIATDILMRRVNGMNGGNEALRDIFLTGGNTLFQGFDERLRTELRAVLPVDSQFNVRRAKDPILDAWRGAAGWVKQDGGSKWKAGRVTREEYLEKGADYLKVRF